MRAFLDAAGLRYALAVRGMTQAELAATAGLTEGRQPAIVLSSLGLPSGEEQDNQRPQRCGGARAPYTVRVMR